MWLFVVVVVLRSISSDSALVVLPLAHTQPARLQGEQKGGVDIEAGGPEGFILLGTTKVTRVLVILDAILMHFLVRHKPSTVSASVGTTSIEELTVTPCMSLLAENRVAAATGSPGLAPQAAGDPAVRNAPTRSRPPMPPTRSRPRERPHENAWLKTRSASDP